MLINHLRNPDFVIVIYFLKIVLHKLQTYVKYYIIYTLLGGQR